MTKIAFAVLVTLGLTTAHAADPALLGTELTANGANPAASADGVIPAYTGGITTPPAGYTRGRPALHHYGAK